MELMQWKCFVCFRFEFGSRMREACLILRNHLNDASKALKSKEEVRDCVLVETASQSHIDPH